LEKIGMAEIAAIILAAGKSSRFSRGGAKLIADFAGKPLVRWAVDAAMASRANPIIVVTGYAREQIQAAIGDPRVVFVHNEDYATGLASSLRAGLAALPREAAGVVICLGDMPKVTSSLIDRLIARFARACGEAHAIVPVHEGLWGNPALIARGLFERIATLEGDEGAKRILKEPTTKVIELPVEDAGALFDIDAPEDLRDFLRQNRIDPSRLKNESGSD
jgi:molybdenum cofactor cytidylyltransferase